MAGGGRLISHKSCQDEVRTGSYMEAIESSQVRGGERNAEHFGWLFGNCGDGLIVTPPKTQMDNGLEKVTPFKNCNFGDINVRVLECTRL